jgi:hypothetical protein
MAGVMLLFAFSMSLVIRIVEKKVLPGEEADLVSTDLQDQAETK